MTDMNSQVVSSIRNLTREYEIVSHNLANVSTPGYKRRCCAFSRLMENSAAANSDPDNRVNLKDSLDLSQGHLIQTERPLDCAIHGKGFFVVETPKGPLYTRKGIFHVGSNGQIVDSMGRTIAGEGGAITVPPTVSSSQLHISSDGNVTANGAVFGKLRIVDFGENESKLVPAGHGCLHMPKKNIRPDNAQNVVVKQGYHEASNVKMVEELVNLVMVTRMYEANMNIVTTKKKASSSLMSVAMG